MRKQRSPIALKYEAFLKRREQGFENVDLTELVIEYHEIYGTGELDPEWDRQRAEYQARFDAENADS